MATPRLCQSCGRKLVTPVRDGMVVHVAGTRVYRDTGAAEGICPSCHRGFRIEAMREPLVAQGQARG